MDTKAKTQHDTLVAATKGKLLSVQERAACEGLSSGEAPHSQWAQALLAIDEGASRAEAAQRSGLTSRQVRYWLSKFNKLGLGIFPQPALESAAEELVVSGSGVLEGQEQVEASLKGAEGTQATESLEAKVEDTAKKPKAKKSKDKKEKKGKKGKKGKEKGKKKGGKKRKSKKAGGTGDGKNKKSKKEKR
jgi:hypothetical protein